MNATRVVAGGFVLAATLAATGVILGDSPAKNPAPGAVKTMDLGGGVKLELAWIPPGTFLMGSPAEEPDRWGNEGPQHEVTLRRGFWMGRHEITQAQWQRMPPGNNPSQMKNPDNPVESVSWHDCMRFVAELNGRARGSEHQWIYRLPTEAEWEYACRAGSTTAFCHGDSLDASQANFDGNFPGGKGSKGQYRQQPMPVGTFRPNAWGLYDMHGNVAEWCQDYGYGVYGGEPATDPMGPQIGATRVVRGGAWHNPGSWCRSAFRNYNSATARMPQLGLRVVLAPAAPDHTHRED